MLQEARDPVRELLGDFLGGCRGGTVDDMI